MTRFCVWDIETSINSAAHGPDAKDSCNDFYTIIYGTDTNDIKVVHKEMGFNRMIPKDIIDIMMSSDVIIGHNIKFDLNYIWKSCPELHTWIENGGQIFDTQYAEYLMSGQRHQFPSLAELQRNYLGHKIKKDRISSLFKKNIGADKIILARERCPRLFRLYEQYCKDDGATTLAIFAKQVARAQSLNMMKIIKLYQRYLLSIVSIENNGMHIDLDKCQKTQQLFGLKYIEHLEKAINACKHLWPNELHQFNPNSNKDASAMLFGGTLSYTVKEQQEESYKNGNPKFKNVVKDIYVPGFGLNPDTYSEMSKNDGVYKKDRDVIDLITLECKDPVILEYCTNMRLSAKYKHMTSTYLNAFANMSINGVLYPNLNNTSTITSRLSSSKPNVQNVPKRDKEMQKYVMGLIYAPKGWKCVQIDFSQLEIFIEAYLSKDPNLIDDLMSGIDFHVLRLSYIENLSYDEIYKLCKVDKVPEWSLKRDQAKTLSYQKAYGAFIDTISEASGIPKEQVEVVFRKEDERYPLAKEYNDGVEAEANKNKTIALVKNIATFQKAKVKHHCGYELLPIRNSVTKELSYTNDEPRHLGWYVSPTGKRYVFDEQCSRGRDGNLYKRFERTKITNYSKQGSAGDVQAITSVGMYNFLYENRGDVKLINEIHDSKWFYVKEEKLSLIIPELCAIMCRVNVLFNKHLDISMPFDFKVDIEVGDNFAEMSSYKEE